MATIGFYYSLNPGPKGLAGVLEEVHRHVGPFLLNVCLKGVHIGMVDGTCSPLKFASNTKVKRLQSGEDGSHIVRVHCPSGPYVVK